MLHSCKQSTDRYTRGIGIYPGNPSENFAPSLVPDNQNYRNIARLRPAWHSSSYDYNLTAQLVTDGIITIEMPYFISVSSDKGFLKKNEREWFFDGKSDSRYRMTGTDIWLQLDMRPDAPEITRMYLAGGVTYDEKKPKGWQFICYGSNDGETWEQIGMIKGKGLPGEERPNPFARMGLLRPAGAAARPSNSPQPSFTFNFTPPRPERMLRLNFEFEKPVSYKSYRISSSVLCAEGWNFTDWDYYSGETKLLMTPSHIFKSAWMSHPCWPSMVWQTYDYYFDPTAAYFGCKKASEAVHIQWNPVYDTVEVVNYNGKDRKNLAAKAQIINMDGSVQWEKEISLDCKEDTTVKCFKLSFPETLSSVHFIKLSLKEGEKTISDNFYWRGLEDGNYQALRSLPAVKLKNNTIVNKSGKEWLITTTLNNASAHPALMIRLNAVGKKSGERILPVFYSDNYFSLMPGESKVITIKLRDEDTQGEKPLVKISGFNI